MDSGAERILIVDDDAALLKVMDSYLSRLGYRVDACRSGAEAWALVQANPSLYAGALVDLNMPAHAGHIQANPSLYAGALVDLNMPGMRGEELARRILDSTASMRLVVMSGYPEGWSGEALDGNRVGFLHKPFAPKELIDALK